LSFEVSRERKKNPPSHSSSPQLVTNEPPAIGSQPFLLPETLTGCLPASWLNQVAEDDLQMSTSLLKYTRKQIIFFEILTTENIFC
jgi:hypothetical protein